VSDTSCVSSLGERTYLLDDAPPWSWWRSLRASVIHGAIPAGTSIGPIGPT